MFQKKEIIYSETMGVCRVEDVTSLMQNKTKQISYYVLRSIFDTEKTAYIPVENHEVHLRPLLQKEEALAKKEQIPELQIDQYKDLIDFPKDQEEGLQEKADYQQEMQNVAGTKKKNTDLTAQMPAAQLQYWKTLYSAVIYMSEDEKRSLYEHAEIAYVLQKNEEQRKTKK